MSNLEDRKLWRALLVGMLLPLALIAYWPSPVDKPVQSELAGFLSFLHAHGVPRWFNYKSVEAAANVALFVPFGIASSLAFPTKQPWQVCAFGLSISSFMELGQLVFLHNRFASVLDLVTNAGGAVIGALLATAALKHLQASRTSAEGL